MVSRVQSSDQVCFCRSLRSLSSNHAEVTQVCPAHFQCHELVLALNRAFACVPANSQVARSQASGIGCVLHNHDEILPREKFPLRKGSSLGCSREGTHETCPVVARYHVSAPCRVKSVLYSSTYALSVQHANVFVAFSRVECVHARVYVLVVAFVLAFSTWRCVTALGK